MTIVTRRLSTATWHERDNHGIAVMLRTACAEGSAALADSLEALLCAARGGLRDSVEAAVDAIVEEGTFAGNILHWLLACCTAPDRLAMVRQVLSHPCTTHLQLLPPLGGHCMDAADVACRYGDLDAIKLVCRAPVLAPRCTMLLHVCGRLDGTPDMVQWLLAFGCSAHGAWRGSRTPFQQACWVGNVEIVRHLLHTATVGAHTLHEAARCGLAEATRRGNSAVVDLLVQFGEGALHLADCSQDVSAHLGLGPVYHGDFACAFGLAVAYGHVHLVCRFLRDPWTARWLCAQPAGACASWLGGMIDAMQDTLEMESDPDDPVRGTAHDRGRGRSWDTLPATRAAMQRVLAAVQRVECHWNRRRGLLLMRHLRRHHRAEARVLQAQRVANPRRWAHGNVPSSNALTEVRGTRRRRMGKPAR